MIFQHNYFKDVRTLHFLSSNNKRKLPKVLFPIFLLKIKLVGNQGNSAYDLLRSLSVSHYIQENFFSFLDKIDNNFQLPSKIFLISIASPVSKSNIRYSFPSLFLSLLYSLVTNNHVFNLTLSITHYEFSV